METSGFRQGLDHRLGKTSPSRQGEEGALKRKGLVKPSLGLEVASLYIGAMAIAKTRLLYGFTEVLKTQVWTWVRLVLGYRSGSCKSSATHYSRRKKEKRRTGLPRPPKADVLNC